MPDMNIGALSWTDLNTHSIDLNQSLHVFISKENTR